MSIQGTGDGRPVPAGPWKELASFTPEQTARFFAGGELGRATFADPELQARQDRQRERLRSALSGYVRILVSALREDSPQTEKRLQELSEGAMQGDPNAKRLFIAMVTELMNQALL